MPMPSNESDLDRTDELPLLDLAVYEASRTHADDGLSSTDTWAAQEFRDLVDAEAAESAEPGASPGAAPWRHANPFRSGSVDLSVNIDGLLNRIAELETTVADSRTANAELESQCEVLRKDRSALEQRLTAVEAGYARVEEQRVISQELAQRLENQLRDQAGQHRARLAEVEATREADQVRAQQERATLERQIEQTTANFSSKVDEHAKLKTALEESLGLAATRAERIDQLQQALADEETAAYTLGRNLAAKLADYDVLVSAVAQRDATIAALERTRTEFAQQLQLSAAQTSSEVERLTRELQAAGTHRDELASERDALAAKVAGLAQITEQLDAAKLEFDRQTAQVDSLEQALQARDVLIENLRAEAKLAQEERAVAAGNLSKARIRIKAMAQRIATADEQIATLKSDLAVHTEALASIRRDIERAGGKQQEAMPSESIAPVLEPLNYQGKSIPLSRKTMTLGRSEDNDIPLDSKLVSRHHARLLVGPNGVIIEDCGSTNGCFVNGQQVKQHVLREGDVLALGELKLRLSMPQAAQTLQRSGAAAGQ